MNGKVGKTFLLGVIAAAIYIALGTILSQIIRLERIWEGPKYFYISAAKNCIQAVVVVVIVILINEKLIAAGVKVNSANKMFAILLPAISLAFLPLFLMRSLGVFLPSAVWYLIDLVIFVLAMFIYVSGEKNNYDNSVVYNGMAPGPNMGQPGVMGQMGVPAMGSLAMTDEEGASLSNALLGAIRPSLKAPLTAVLCNKEEMVITENNGVYTIEGYVSSQNSYGAMIATDFTATAIKQNGQWVITGTKIGVKNAKKYAKNFVANYILISIFTVVGGLLLYYIISMSVR